MLPNTSLEPTAVTSGSLRFGVGWRMFSAAVAQSLVVRRLRIFMADARFEQKLTTQLTMNRQTWAVLQQHGVTEQSQLRLDFTYNALSKDAAESLVALIQDQTDYKVRVESSGSFLRRKWRVEGTTQPTAISPEILDQWVTWMVMAGKERVCDFDGFGTPV